METMVVIAMVGIVTLSVGVLLANSQKNWNQLLGRVYSDEATDSIALQNVFDNICRKSSLSKYILGTDADSLEMYYWDSVSTSATPENYGFIYQNNDDVYVEYGKLQFGTWQKDGSEPTSTIQIARGVDMLKFVLLGTSVQMYVTFIDEDTLPVVCSSVRRNE